MHQAQARLSELTVPSPPQARILKLCTLRYISSLGQGRTGIASGDMRHSQSLATSLSPEGLVEHSRFPGSSLAQIKDLSGIQIPQKRLDDLGTLQGQPRDSEEGNEVRRYQRHTGRQSCGSQTQ